MTQVAMKKKPRSKCDVLRVPALEVRQGKNRRLYSFAVDGKLLHSFCTVSRISRQTEETLSGYQRPEVASHISQIRDYLESESPLLPNAIVVAFDGTVKCKPVAGAGGSPYSRMGHLEIPIGPFVDDTLKPGWIVDGQQRSAALRDAKVGSFPVCVVGFVTEGFEEQRQQFILVNATKPLPKGLIYELLPSTDGKLPIALQKRRHPAELLERLNFDEDSPLKGLIRTTTNGSGVIADNSILAMLQNSLTDGCLYRFVDMETQLDVLKSFWEAVRIRFPSAWGIPPKKSRLMHGAGIIAMGFLMDTIAEKRKTNTKLSVSFFSNELQLVCSHCRWISGTWDFGGGKSRQWDEVQNLPGHIQLLSNHLLTVYRKAAPH
jgi:DGQHR domain-containing protein